SEIKWCISTGGEHGVSCQRGPQDITESRKRSFNKPPNGFKKKVESASRSEACPPTPPGINFLTHIFLH
ncbi:jg846, partial [Pararge aegeria aegeria]